MNFGFYTVLIAYSLVRKAIGKVFRVFLNAIEDKLARNIIIVKKDHEEYQYYRR